MTDWRSVGAIVREQWSDERRGTSERFEQLQRRIVREAPMLSAVAAYKAGDRDAVRALLRSDCELNLEDLEALRQFERGGFEQHRGPGAPKSNERWVAMQAQYFLDKWRAALKLAGISSYGHGDAMRDEAIEFIVANHVPKNLKIDREKVAEFMTKRGKSRRN